MSARAKSKSKAKSKTAAFLWEIGCEEIPASWLARTMRELEDRTTKELEAVGLDAPGLAVSGTLRRLIVHAPRLASVQADRSERITGPPVSVARDESGGWSRAATGFAKKNGVGPDELVTFTTDKGEYLGFERTTKGRKRRSSCCRTS